MRIGNFRGSTAFYASELSRSIYVHSTKILYIVPDINDLGADEYHIKSSSKYHELNLDRDCYLRSYLDIWH